MRTITTLAVCLGLAAPAVSQTKHVYPNQASDAEGSGSVENHRGGAPWWPIASQVPGEQHFRMQLITDLPATVQGSIINVAYRRDGAVLPSRAIEQLSVELEATMSTSPRTAATASDVFAANVGADVTQVINRKTVVFGTNEFHGSFPEPFFYGFLFDQPFPYDATRGSLCFEIKHYYNDLAHPLRPYALPGSLDAMPASKDSAKLRNGGRCSAYYYEPPIEFNAELMIDDSTGSPRLRYWGHRQYAEHHSRGFFIGSLARINPGLPLTAPGDCGVIEMDPNQQWLLAIADSDGTYGRVRWPAGQGTFLFDLPYDPLWAGAELYAQEVNMDVHTRYFSATNWVLTQVPVYLGPGASFDLRVVSAEGPGSHTAVQGTLGPLGIGPVIEYTTQ